MAIKDDRWLEWRVSDGAESPSLARAESKFLSLAPLSLVDRLPRLSGVSIRIVSSLDAFERLQRPWDRMVERRFGAHPMLDHFWFVNYYRSFFPGACLRVLTAHTDDGAMVAALPTILSLRVLGGIPLRQAQLLAGPHSHCNQLLVGPEHGEILRRFVLALFDEGADLVYLEDLSGAFPDEAWFERFAEHEGALAVRRVVRRSPYIRITGSFEEFRRTLSKKFRGQLNNRLNRIERAGGFEIRCYEDLARFDEMLEEMRAVCAESWQGSLGTGLFSARGNELFYRALLRHNLERGSGRVFVLHCEGRPAAFELHLYHGAHEYCLKAEFSQAHSDCSPGGVLDQELVRRAFDSPTQIYDLLGFDDEYKLRWTSLYTEHPRYFLFNRTVPARLAHILSFRIGDSLRANEIMRRIRRQQRRRSGQGSGSTSRLRRPRFSKTNSWT